MKCSIITTLAMLALAIPCGADAAESFFLRYKNSDTYGPFECRDGEAVRVGRKTFHISKVLTSEQRILERMDAIHIPAIALEDATVEDVVRFLQDVSREHDSSDRAEAERGLTFLFAPGFNGTAVESGDATAKKAAAGAEVKDVRGTISLSAQNVSMRSALAHILPLLNLKYLLRNDLVLLVDKNAPESPLLHRVYPVLPSVRERISVIEEGMGSEQPPEPELSEWQRFFSTFGVAWPKGSSIRYVSSIGKIVVMNTLENLQVFEKALRRLNVIPFQIELEAQLVGFARSEIEALSVSGPIQKEALMQLRREGKGSLLAAPKIVTQSGSEATIDDGAFLRNEGGRPVLVAARRDQDGDTRPVPAPAASQPMGRDLRTVFSVLPEVSPEGQLINVTLVLSLGFNAGPVAESAAAQQPGAETLAAPATDEFVANTEALSTSVMAASGSTVLVGCISGRTSDELVYVFLSVQLIGIDGRPLPVDKDDLEWLTAPRE